MNAITTVDGTDKLNINTNGGNINTTGGFITTSGVTILADGTIHASVTINADGTIHASGLIYANGGINTGGGGIDTNNGDINTGGGNITTVGGDINIQARTGNEHGDFRCGIIIADGRIHANDGIKTKTIVIPRTHHWLDSSARVLRFKSEFDNNDKNSLDIAYIPFINDDNKSKRWQIRQTHSFHKAPNDIYENTQGDQTPDQWGLNENGDDFNDHDSTHWYFAKTDDNEDLAG